MITNHDTSINDKQSQVLQKKSNEWYTPPKYIEAARIVMGGIEIDPASCKQANQVVKATQYYTKEQNGLLQPWKGRVWLNPPYGRTEGGVSMSHQKAFAQKLLLEYQQGHIEQAIILSLGNPNSVWFQDFFHFVLCFVRGTIVFSRPDGSEGHFGFPLSFVYLGPNESAFIEVFSKFGPVVKRVSPPKQEICTALDLWSALNTSNVDQESCRETA